MKLEKELRNQDNNLNLKEVYNVNLENPFRGRYKSHNFKKVFVIPLEEKFQYKNQEKEVIEFYENCCWILPIDNKNYNTQEYDRSYFRFTNFKKKCI